MASRTIGPGERIRRSDLRLEAIDLPASLERNALSNLDGLDDVISTGPIGADELVQSSLLARVRGSRETRELSLVVQADWAVGGTLRSGNRIDVLVTYGDRADATTDVVLAGATVRRVSTVGNGGIGGTRTQTVTVAIDDPAQVRTVTNAARAGDITITRATGAPVAGEASGPDGEPPPVRPGTSTDTTGTGPTTTLTTSVGSGGRTGTTTGPGR